MTPIKAEFELTAADCEELSRTTLGAFTKHPLMKMFRGFSLLGIAVPGIFAAFSPVRAPNAPSPAACIAMTVLFLALYVWAVGWAQRRFVERTVGKPWSCTVDETTAQWSGPYGEGTLQTSSPIRWRDTPTFIILARQGESSLVVPKRVLTTEQLHALRSILEAHARPSRF